jgi:hypothetical protein
MGAFGRLSKNQFGSAVSGFMGSTTSVFQQLHLYVGTQNKKQLTHLSMSANADTSPVAIADRVYRVIVCSGPIAPNQEAGLTVLDLSPIFPTYTLIGANRIFLDQVFKGSVEVDFDEPIIVGPEEQLNVVMGVSYANGDSSLTPSVSVAHLSWQGWEGERKTSEFPYDLR